MAGCKLTQNQIDQAVNFHGHRCPGLAIGLRAGEYVLENLGRASDEEIVALAETDMCAVDADQEDPARVVAQATEGKMADVVMDVSGHPSGAGQALALAGLGATVVLPGLYGAGVEVPLLLDKVVVNELRVRGAYSQDFESVEAAIAIARRGAYPLEDMISHRFPLEQAEEAVRLVGGEKRGEMPLKVVLDPSL